MRMVEKTLEINGRDFEHMVRNGLAHIGMHMEEVNALNVFPVPDGDTGSNLYLTLRNAVEQATQDRDLDAYLKSLSDKMLLGARGNSGVILSQLFKGFADRLSGKDEADAGDLRAALIAAYRTAYASVQRPVEGTMLTVAREGIEKLRGQLESNMPIEQLFSYYIAEMRRSLSYTPMLLPALKEAGVVDSGAMGWIFIVEGMLKALYGETLQDIAHDGLPAVSTENTEHFGADASFTFGYCTEFLLQLLTERADPAAFCEETFSEALGALGDSLVVVRSGDRVKVHVHTKTPARVIELAQRYGEFVSFKLENMHLQHNQFMQQKKHYPLAVLAVSNGDGLTALYREFEACKVIDGGEMMNASCRDFLNAFDQMEADHIIVLPNNKNTVSAARQATQLAKRENIEVLPSTNVVQGYLALSMDIATDSVQERAAAFHRNLEEVCTLCFARAVRFSNVCGQACYPGDYLAFCNGKAMGCHRDAAELLRCVAEQLELEPEYLQIFCGAGMDEARLQAFCAAVQEQYEDAELECIDSGHTIYDMIVSIS